MKIKNINVHFTEAEIDKKIRELGARISEDFLGYARQVLEQAAILEDKYKGQDGGRTQFFLLFRGDFFTFGEKEKYPCERQGNAV